MLLDDFAADDLSPRWSAITDAAMGGRSQAQIARVAVDGRNALHLTGEVRPVDGVGFVEAALRFDGAVDATGFAGVRIAVQGPVETYALALRTADCIEPWQSYRADFLASSGWREVRLPFGGFQPHRLDRPLDPARLTGLALLAVGRAFRPDLALGEIALYH